MNYKQQIKMIMGIKRRQKSPLISLLFVYFFYCMCTNVFSAESVQNADEAAVQVKTGTVIGRFVVKGGGSMEGGQVLFYRAGDEPSPPDMTKYTRVPIVDLTREILADGNFLAVLPEGKYYFGAIKRKSGQKFGRPQTGDLYFRSYRPNSRELKEFSVHEGDLIDFGILVARPLQGKFKPLTGKTTIEGKLSDPDGNPIENGIVFAFLTPQIKGSRPNFTSDPTGKDGKYTLYVGGDETYYLMARDVMGGGQVAEGGIIGIYGGPEKPIGVGIKSGEKVEGLDIKVYRIHRGPVPEKTDQNKLDPTKKKSINPAQSPSQ